MNIGTTEENAARIMVEGFRPGTYFGSGLQDAVNYGGNFVFTVYFPEKPTDYWEYISLDHIPPEQIFQLFEMHRDIRYYNKQIEQQMRYENLREQHGGQSKICDACDGRGQLEEIPPFTRWRDMPAITICEKCGGYGVSNLNRQTLELE